MTAPFTEATAALRHAFGSCGRAPTGIHLQSGPPVAMMPFTWKEESISSVQRTRGPRSARRRGVRSPTLSEA